MPQAYCCGVFFIFFLAVFLDTQGQTNLVKNPSFEVFDNCPEKWNGQKTDPVARYWDLPTDGTADYFNECSKQAGVPINWAGFQQARTGKGYAGLAAVQKAMGKETDYREYVQGQLLERLQTRQLYCISFYVSLAELAGRATDALGVFLYASKVNQTGAANLGYATAMRNAANNVITEREEWIRLCASYMGKGGERYLVIGNFDAVGKSVIEEVKPVKDVPVLEDAAYYFIDDVSITAIEGKEECDCAPKQPPADTLAGNSGPQFNDFEVLFPTAGYTLTSHQKTMLKVVVAELLKTEQTIFVYGHTDNVGSLASNQLLSERRALAVANQLKNLGIPAKRIKTKGEGELKPKAGNGSETDRQINRRATISLAPN